MKHAKKWICCLLAVVMAVLSTGCSTAFVDIEQMMKPPKATGNKAALNKLLAETAGTPDFIYPTSGSNRAAITMVPFFTGAPPFSAMDARTTSNTLWAAWAALSSCGKKTLPCS